MANGASWIGPALADGTSKSIRFYTPSNMESQKISTMIPSDSNDLNASNSNARSNRFRRKVGGVPLVSMNFFGAWSRRNVDLASSLSDTSLQASSIWGFSSQLHGRSACSFDMSCTSIQKADDTYHQVYTHAQERKLLRRRADLELNLEDARFCGRSL